MEETARARQEGGFESSPSCYEAALAIVSSAGGETPLDSIQNTNSAANNARK